MDHLILCLPPNQIQSLVPQVQVPTLTRPILNVHFGLDEKYRLPRNAAFIGVINGISQWIFRRGTTLSVTVSRANALMDKDTEDREEAGGMGNRTKRCRQSIGRGDLPGDIVL